MPEETKSELEQKNQKRRQVGRSPAYPFLGLAKAIERAAQLRASEGSYEAPVTAAYDAWDLGHKSSTARQTAAALRYYGLIEVTGEGDARRVKVSDMAARILMDDRDDQTERKKLIREAALKPKIHSHLMLRFPEGLPSDSNVRHHLIFDKGFNDKSSDEVLKVFRDTAAYANLYEPVKVLDKSPTSADDSGSEGKAEVVAEGDKIQWTSMGSDMFKEPATVLGLSDDGLWVFTDQHGGGISIGDVTVIEQQEAAGSGEVTPPPVPAHILAAQETLKARQNANGAGPIPEGSREDKVSLDEGDAMIRWPENLSADSFEEFEYWINGVIKRAKRRAGMDS